MKKLPKKKSSAKKSVANPKSRSAPLSAKKSDADFAAVFASLRRVLAAFVPELRVTRDEPRRYDLVTKSNSWRGGPMAFGTVMTGKAYVSYHLLPLYVFPELTKAVSPDLKKRKQGKACFNFRSLDEALFAELGALTKLGLQKYKSKNLL